MKRNHAIFIDWRIEHGGRKKVEKVHWIINEVEESCELMKHVFVVDFNGCDLCGIVC